MRQKNKAVQDGKMAPLPLGHPLGRHLCFCVEKRSILCPLSPSSCHRVLRAFFKPTPSTPPQVHQNNTASRYVLACARCCLAGLERVIRLVNHGRPAPPPTAPPHYLLYPSTHLQSPCRGVGLGQGGVGSRPMRSSSRALTARVSARRQRRAWASC